MKEDYLWNKTGNDAEIEKLENALKAFRQKDDTPPAIPQKNSPVKIESKRNLFPFAFAFAASVTFVLILVGVWFQISVGENSPQDNLVKNASQNKSEVVKAETVETQTEFPSQAEEKPIIEISEKPATKRKPKVHKTNKRKIHPTKKAESDGKTKQKVPAKSEIAELTDEERYAYNQLMLALSITSEKLNLVKDKVRGEVKEEISIKKKIENRSN